MSIYLVAEVHWEEDDRRIPVEVVEIDTERGYYTDEAKAQAVIDGLNAGVTKRWKAHNARAEGLALALDKKIAKWQEANKVLRAAGLDPQPASTRPGKGTYDYRDQKVYATLESYLKEHPNYMHTWVDVQEAK